MDLKNLSLDLLGLRLTFKLPRISLKEQETESEEVAEYHLKVEQRKETKEEDQDQEMEVEQEGGKMSYLEWRYGDKLSSMVADTAMLDTAEMARPRMRPVRRLSRMELRRRQEQEVGQVGEEEARRLGRDARVVAQLLSVEQVARIETWLSAQPDQFQQMEEEMEEEDHYAEIKEEEVFTMEDVQDSHQPAQAPSQYQDILSRGNVHYRRVTIV